MPTAVSINTFALDLGYVDCRSNYTGLKQHDGRYVDCKSLVADVSCWKFVFAKLEVDLCFHFRSNYVGVKQRGGIHVSFCDNMRQRDFDFLSCDPIELQCEAIFERDGH